MEAVEARMRLDKGAAEMEVESKKVAATIHNLASGPGLPLRCTTSLYLSAHTVLLRCSALWITFKVVPVHFSQQGGYCKAATVSVSNQHSTVKS